MLTIKGFSSSIDKQSFDTTQILANKISYTCNARVYFINKTLPKAKPSNNKKQQKLIPDFMFSDSSYIKSKISLNLSEENNKKIQVSVNRDLYTKKIMRQLQKKKDIQAILNSTKKAMSLRQIYCQQSDKNCEFKKNTNYQSVLLEKIQCSQKINQEKQQINIPNIQINQPVLPLYMQNLMKPCVIKKASFSKRPTTTRLIATRRKFSQSGKCNTQMSKTTTYQHKQQSFSLYEDIKQKIQPWLSQQIQ